MVAVAIAAALAAGTAVLMLSGCGGSPEQPGPPPAAPAGACNGSRALCSRRLDQVAFAATHNSYAASDEPGWRFASQRHGIARQLRDGVRALLIDIH